MGIRQKTVSAALVLLLLGTTFAVGIGSASAEGSNGTTPGHNPRDALYTMNVTLSDQAQENTIAFDALAFLTGNLGADSFFPPGKVADLWGFQYLRDNDLSKMGHNTDFLTKAANNMLYVLNDGQKAALIAFATTQVDDIEQYGLDRFVLIDGFHRLLNDDIPENSTGLDLEVVMEYSSGLYRLDGQMCLDRARVMGGILHSLNDTQRAYLDALRGEGMLDWPEVGDQLDPRSLAHDEHVAVMTYAGDLLSWYLGSVEADVYFCPERQGTYFGSFYLKDAPAMGNPNYTIDETITANSGASFMNALSASQRQLVTDLVSWQKPYLLEMVELRAKVSAQLRQYIVGETPDEVQVLNDMERYGELDGALVCRYATAFVEISETMTSEQRQELASLRAELGVSTPAGAFLYSQAIDMPSVPDTDFLFASSATEAPSTDPGSAFSLNDTAVLTIIAVLMMAILGAALLAMRRR
jgi:hypothetical protein